MELRRGWWLSIYICWWQLKPGVDWRNQGGQAHGKKRKQRMVT